MSVVQAFRHVCDWCEATADSAEQLRGWKLETQPSRATCAVCLAKKQSGEEMSIHASHKTRVSMSASSYDEICDLCGATDTAGSNALKNPCPVQSTTGEQFNADYFLRGKQTGKSLYEDYRWLPDLTIPMAVRMISHCGIKPEHSILDFGCARGYTVRAFREMGYDAWGYDISQWALENADEAAKEYLIVNSSTMFAGSFDWVVAKDVLEHVQQVENTIANLMSAARVGVFVVVPLGYGKNGYVVPEYDLDVTHIYRMTLPTWAGMFMRPGWSVEARYRVPGVKDNYAKHEKGNGFITARRLI